MSEPTGPTRRRRQLAARVFPSPASTPPSPAPIPHPHLLTAEEEEVRAELEVLLDFHCIGERCLRAGCPAHDGRALVEVIRRLKEEQLDREHYIDPNDLDEVESALNQFESGRVAKVVLRVVDAENLVAGMSDGGVKRVAKWIGEHRPACMPAGWARKP